MPVHVGSRTNNGEAFPLPLGEMWEIFCDELLNIAWLYDVRIHAFVLMVNHYHLILTSPIHEIGKVMCEFNKAVSRRVNSRAGREGHLFRTRYFGTEIQTVRQFATTLKYVYRNPVKAGICQKVEQYPYGSLQGLLGIAPLPFPVSHPYGEPFYLQGSDEIYDALEWLNIPFDNEHDRAIGKALKRSVFKYSKRFERELERGRHLSDGAPRVQKGDAPFYF